MAYRATSPRRDIREAKVFSTTGATDMAPVDTPIHPDAAAAAAQQQQQTPKGPAYAQSVYERRMGRSRSPNAHGSSASQAMGTLFASNGPYQHDAGMTPARNNTQYYTPSRATNHNQSVNNNHNNLNYSTAGTTGGGYTPSQTILADRQQYSRPNPAASASVVGSPHRGRDVALRAASSSAAPGGYGYGYGASSPADHYNSSSADAAPGGRNNYAVASPTTTVGGGIVGGADLSLTAPDKAMLEMLIAEAQDRHFVEKLFVAQEEKHERNQWLSIEAHRRRMLQMNYAAPVRVARMEVSQEQRVGDLIAEFEVGPEILEQRRRMDARVAELRSMIETTNKYRDALEELENDHKAKHERDMADLDDERRAKKRLLDELTRQYEFASVHNRSDDLYSGAFGLRAGMEFQRAHRRDPDPLKSPSLSGPRAVEAVAEQGSATAHAIRQSAALSPSARDHNGTGAVNSSRYGTGNSVGLVMSMANAQGAPSASAAPAGAGANGATNYSTMTNFGNPHRGASGSPDHQHYGQQQQSGSGGIYSEDAPSAPAAPLYEPAAVPPQQQQQRSYSHNSATADVIMQSQLALLRAEELERSANSRPTRY